MKGVLQDHCDIQTVTDLQPGEFGWRLTLANGSTLALSRDHPDSEVILELARSLIAARRPAGLLADAGGRLIDLNTAVDATVRSVEDADERLQVECWGVSSICYLRREHPEFQRVRDLLMRAAASGERIRLAMRLRPVEEETEVWMEVLDARPITAAAPC